MYIVIDKDGNPYGLFESAYAAAAWAERAWPGVPERESDQPDAGWRVCALRLPDEMAVKG